MQATAATLTMTKKEAAQFLGKSPRSLAEYMAQGKLPVTYVSGPNGKQAMLQRADVERLKRDMDTPMVRALPVGQSVTQALSRIADAPADAARSLSPLVETLAASIRTGLQGSAPRPWLTLDEAAAYSGLPKAFLLAQAREGKPVALNVGSEKKRVWRFNRDALRTALN